MSLTKVKNAFMFLHVFDKEEEQNNVRGFSDQIPKKEYFNKQNMISDPIFSLKK
jgi:hypothetical protein